MKKFALTSPLLKSPGSGHVRHTDHERSGRYPALRTWPAVKSNFRTCFSGHGGAVPVSGKSSSRHLRGRTCHRLLRACLSCACVAGSAPLIDEQGDTLSRGWNITPASNADIRRMYRRVFGKPLWHPVATGRKLSSCSRGHPMRLAFLFKTFRSPRAEPLLCLSGTKARMLSGTTGKTGSRR